MNKLISVLSICVLTTTAVNADPVTVPNTFSAGTPAKASEVNANFTALANAVNAAPKPLMVYDSTGKLIGQQSFWNYYSIAIITATGSNAIKSPVALGIKTTGFYDVYYSHLPLWYISPNCTGDAYVEGQDAASPVFGFILTASNQVLIPVSENPVNASFASRKYINPDGTNWSACINGINSLTNMVLYSQAPLLDLSTYTPPFSVH